MVKGTNISHKAHADNTIARDISSFIYDDIEMTLLIENHIYFLFDICINFVEKVIGK